MVHIMQIVKQSYRKKIRNREARAKGG